MRGKKKSYSSSAHRGYSENPKENKKTTNFQHLMQQVKFTLVGKVSLSAREKVPVRAQLLEASSEV